MTQNIALLKPGRRGIHELVFEELQSVVGQVKLHKNFNFIQSNVTRKTS